MAGAGFRVRFAGSAPRQRAHWLGQALTATLRALGVDTRHLVGGVQDWQAKGRPIEPLAAAADAG